MTTTSPETATTVEQQVTKIIINERQHEKLPVHLEDSRFPEPLMSLIGCLEAVGMVWFADFRKDHRDEEYTFARALEQQTCAIRAYDQHIAKAGGASPEQRLATMRALRSEYIGQQERFRDKHGYIPGGDENSCEVQAIDAVLTDMAIEKFREQSR